MTDIIAVKKLDNVWVQVLTEPGIIREMSDYFTFTVPGAQFTPAYKNKMWDGKIRLLNGMTGKIYAGLTKHIQKFCHDRGYNCVIDPDLETEDRLSADDILGLAKAVKAAYEPRDYQRNAIAHALNRERALLLSPTASGKSFIIYLIAQFHIHLKRRVLVIVPTTSLVAQMASDFVEYNHNKSLSIHKIMAGQSKNSNEAITVTTWQSIHKMPKKWFEQFDVVFGDEAHNFKAKSLTSILEKTPDIRYRYGLTGTLDGTQTHKLVLEGLFGPVFQVTRTKTLIDKGDLATFDIKGLVLQYNDESRKHVKGMTYQREIDWLVKCDARNKFIRNLAWGLKGNTLILFQFVDKHGKILYPLLEGGKQDIHFVHGGINTDERERIRHHVEATDNNIILASYGTFSTGVNIKKLDNIIFASPSKSKIRNLQSIGRGLRKGNGKTNACLYDIADDLVWKTTKNFAARHFMERVQQYSDEGFDMNVYNVKLKE